MNSAEEADEIVLKMIFSGPTEGYTFVENQIEEQNTLENVKEKISLDLKEKEILAVQLAEDGKLEESLTLLNLIIFQSKNYFSVYNNRAQVYRLLKDDKLAIKDLNYVIEKCKDLDVLKQTYAQRAILLKGSQPDQSYNDFCKSAKLGNEIAKQAVVEENPYKKLCQTMVQQAMAYELDSKK